MFAGASMLNPLGLGRSQPLPPIVETRAPTSNDVNPEWRIGQLWVNKSTNIVYVLTSVAGTATWTAFASASGNVDTLSGDSGTATPSSGDIVIAGGTNLTSAASGSTVTVNMDAAITLATSVTSPVYTSAAATDMSVLAPTGQDINVTLGDASAANKMSWLDTGAAEVASLDSNGGMTALSFATSAATAGITISGDDIDADGSDSNISITVSPKGTGDFIVDVGDIQATAGDIIATRSSASGDVTVECTNSDNTAADSDAFFEVAVGGTSGGNPGIRFQISSGQNYSMGIDNADSDKLVICADNDLGTDVLAKFDETTKDVEITQGNLVLAAVAKQIQLNGGAVTDFIGQATLSSGTVSVANTNIAAGDRIFVTRSSLNSSTALGELVTAISAGASFSITSVSVADGSTTITGDTSVVDYIIFRQN